MDQGVKTEPISEENGAKQDVKGGRPDNRGQNQNNRRGRGGGGRGGGNFGARRDYVQDRLESMSGPSTNLQNREEEGKKFTGRCKLYVGNLPNNITEEDFRNMFTPFGETSEIFLNKQKGFGFVKLDTRQNAREAKTALDHSFRDGRTLRVKFANNDSALKIKNLSPWVSDELLEAAFGVFGEVERAVVIVDSRGNSVGEGIVEYSRKQSAELALRRCTEGCFILTSSPRPVLVEPLDQRDEEGGLPEKNFPKANDRYLKEREVGPRLVEPSAAEFDFCDRWKKLFALEQQKRDYLEKEIQEARRALDDQMEFYIYEHEARMLRERLHRMEEQSNFIQQELKLKREKDLQREEARLQQEMALRQQEEEILRRRTVDDMQMHRRQEDTLIMQEAALRQMQGADGMSTGTMVSEHMAFPNGMMPSGGMGMSPSVEMKIELGHRASMRNKPTAEGFTHDWLVFVKGAEGSNISTFVDKVVFHLHDSFPRPERVVNEPPYQVAESGYAGFAMPIDIYFQRKEDPQKVRFLYDFFLGKGGSPVYNVRLKKLTFQEPSEDFRRKLLKARESVEMKLVLGHCASVRDKPTAEGFTHDWLVFVKGAEGSNFSTFVDKVVFHLHESFPRPERVVEEPPYQVAESGYAGFTMPIDIYFRRKVDPPKVRFLYDFFLGTGGSPVYNFRCEKLIFRNPS